MKKIMLMVFLLVASLVHGEEYQSNTSPSQAEVEAVERQLVQSGLLEEEARTMTRAMVRAGFTEEHMVQFGKQIPSGSHQRVITEAIRDKVHEGVAKKAPPEAILIATERVRNRYQNAIGLTEKLDQKNQVQITRAFADCLAAGLTRQDARIITDAIQQRTKTSKKIGSRKNLISETLFTGRDMVRQGISSETTADLLRIALEHGYNEKSMRTLRHTLRNRKIENLEKTAKQYRWAIENGAQAGGLKDISYSGGERRGAAAQENGQQNNDSTGGGSGGGESGGSSGSGGSGGSGENSGNNGDQGGGGNGGNSGGEGNSGGGTGSGRS